jgi:hypothetical protein
MFCKVTLKYDFVDKDSNSVSIPMYYFIESIDTESAKRRIQEDISNNEEDRVIVYRAEKYTVKTNSGVIITSEEVIR